jgi:DNA primase catalytic core
MIAQETIDRILAATDIAALAGEYVKLTKRGASYVGRCPLHSERTPSFTVSPARGMYKCFGCGAAGNAIKLLQELEQVSFPDAVRRLAARAGVAVEDSYQPTDEEQAKYARRESLKSATRWAQGYFFAFDSKAPIHAYLLGRGFTGKIAQKFGVGYAPAGWHELEAAATKSGYGKEALLGASLISEGERGAYSYFRGRVMFPICDVVGSVVGFTGRAIADGEKAKYLNSKDSELFSKGRCLFGIHLAKQEMAKQDECYLVEGNFDVLRLHALGVENAVAACGTALTREQAALIRRFTANVTLCYDGDSAGGKATFKNAELLLSEGMNVRMVALPAGEDPDSYGRKNGAAALKKLLGTKLDFVSFKYAQLQLASQNDPAALSAAAKELVRTIAVIPDEASRQVYVKTVSTTFGIDAKPIAAAVKKAAVKPVEVKESGWTGLDAARDAIRAKDKCYVTTLMETLASYHASGKDNTVAYFGALDRAHIQELSSLTRHVELVDNDTCFVDHRGNSAGAAPLCFRLLELRVDVVVQEDNGEQAATVNFLTAYPNACRRQLDAHESDEAMRVKLLEQCCELLALLDETQLTISLKTFAAALKVTEGDLKKILKPKLSAKKSRGALKRSMSSLATPLHTLDINRLPEYVDREQLYVRRFFPYQDENGRKVFYVFLGDDNTSLRVVGNFYVEPLFHVYDHEAMSNKRVVKINNINGQTYYAEWDSERMTEVGQFKKLLFREGGNVFINGRAADYDKILYDIGNSFPRCTAFRIFGQQRAEDDEDFYAFPNAILSDGQIRYADELGLVQHKGRIYYSPSFSKVHRELWQGNDTYEADRWFAYRESSETDFGAWARLMVEVYSLNHNGCWALLFAIMSAFRSDIYPINRHFTAPFFVGPTESGKTQLAVSIRALFIHPDATPFNLNTGTDAALSTYLERYRDVALVFEEYNNYQITDIKFQALKSAVYDGEGKQKRKDASSKDINVSKVNCALVLLGQEAPARDDNALANRCIMLPVPKKDDWTNEERDLLDELKRRERQGLGGVLVEILRQRGVVRQRFAGVFKEALRELKADLTAAGAPMQTRILNTASLFLATARLWEEHVPSLRLPFTYAEFYAVAREKAITQSESITSTNRLSVFFETVELLLHQQQHGSLRLGEQLKLEWKKTVTLQGGRSETYEKTFERETRVLYLRLKLIHPRYYDIRRSEALSMSDLHSFLKDHKAYIGTVGSTRFSWMEYEEAVDPVSPERGVRKVERRASANSSAVALDYEKLRELTGVDYEKYKPEDNAAAQQQQLSLPDEDAPPF